MSVVLNSLPFSNKEGEYRPLAKNLSNGKKKNEREHAYGNRDSAECRITLEGWTNTPQNESFFFGNQDDRKSEETTKDRSENLGTRGYPNVFKNTLNNLSEGLALMHRKNLNFASIERDKRTQGGEKLTEPPNNLEFESPNKDKEIKETPKPTFETQDEKLEIDRFRDTFKKAEHQQWISKRYVKSPNVEQSEASLLRSKDREKSEKIDMGDKSHPIWKFSKETVKSSKKEIPTLKIQNLSTNSTRPVRQNVQMISFENKLSTAQMALLQRFKVFSHQSYNQANETIMKSARETSWNFFDKDGDLVAGRETKRVEPQGQIGHINSPKNMSRGGVYHSRKTSQPLPTLSTQPDLGLNINAKNITLTNWDCSGNEMSRKKTSLKKILVNRMEINPVQDPKANAMKWQLDMTKLKTEEVVRTQVKPKAKEGKQRFLIPLAMMKESMEYLRMNDSSHGESGIGAPAASNYKTKSVKSQMVTAKTSRNSSCDKEIEEIIEEDSNRGAKTHRIVEKVKLGIWICLKILIRRSGQEKKLNLSLCRL